MEGNENSKPLMQLLEHVKHCSDSANSSTFSNQTGNVSDRLMDLQRQAQQIQQLKEIVTSGRLPRQVVTSSELKSPISPPQPHEIYQNLGPLMGSGLRNAPPALPPKGRKIFKTHHVIYLTRKKCSFCT